MRNCPPRQSRRLAAPKVFLGCSIAAALLAALPALGKKSLIKNTPTNDIAEQVLRDPLATPLGETMPPLRCEFFLLEDARIEAAPVGAGTIFATSGGERWLL